MDCGVGVELGSFFEKILYAIVVFLAVDLVAVVVIEGQVATYDGSSVSGMVNHLGRGFKVRVVVRRPAVSVVAYLSVHLGPRGRSELPFVDKSRALLKLLAAIAMVLNFGIGLGLYIRQSAVVWVWRIASGVDVVAPYALLFLAFFMAMMVSAKRTACDAILTEIAGIWRKVLLRQVRCRS